MHRLFFCQKKSYNFLSIFKTPFLAENACDILKPERKEPKEEPP